jgi:hypothetical protein
MGAVSARSAVSGAAGRRLGRGKTRSARARRPRDAEALPADRPPYPPIVQARATPRQGKATVSHSRFLYIFEWVPAQRSRYIRSPPSVSFYSFARRVRRVSSS